MAVSQRLELRQTQTLVMTQQLQQAVKLLQLSNLELGQYLETEIQQNPLLERADPGEEKARDEGERAEAPDGAQDTSEGELQADLDMGGDARAEFDWDSAETFDSRPGGAQGRDGGDMSFEETVSETIDLRQHLLTQLQIEIDEPADRIIGVHLIDMLDESGYVTGDLDALAQLLGCETERVTATLSRLQRFDPPGLFARSLKECLALQLIERNRYDPAMEALLDNLDLLARRELARLRKLCGVDQEDLAQMVAEVRALDPKPALAFDHRPIEPAIPDVFVRPRPDGGWLIELNSETLPRVLVNREYYVELSSQARDKEEKAYISACYESGSWLIKALHQRATTILRVAEEIVRQQDAFFRKGVHNMKPLTQREIAEEIEMHESTISRVTNNKYVATPRGLYELRYFFSASLPSTEDNAALSAEAVRQRIKRLIDGESPSRPLSDDGIVSALKGEGIEVARRTVAKYREAMRIPSSVQRRREKSLQT
ncbi:MAG: RNA polymerase factor sigma-54 [Pseudomonadota bacterium]